MTADAALRAPARARIVNLGCKVNQSEIEAAARLLRERGTRLVGDAEPADLVIVNTCTVTGVADQKSRQALRRVRREHPAADIIATGCAVAVDRHDFARVDPTARLVDNDGKGALLAELAGLGPAVAATPDAEAALDGPLPTLAGVELDGIADGRTAVDRTRAFVKVQDGCSFFCTYCIIPRARGPERSLPPDVVIADVRRAVSAGHREVVLSGINIGTYDGGWSERGRRGSHARAALTLAGLVRRILAETDVERIRVSSIEPQHVDDDLLAAWLDGAPRTLPHLHLPLQAGDDGVLRRMGRRYDSAAYAQVVEAARTAIGGLAVYADVIVGFPTEDDAAFERTVGLVRSLDLAGLHVFRYSARPGTPATRMAGQVPEPIRRERSAVLLRVAAEARARRAAARVGSIASVLLETALDDGRWVGHAEDHVLVAAAGSALSAENAIARVELVGLDEGRPDRLDGRILEISAGRPLRARTPLDLPVLAVGGAA